MMVKPTVAELLKKAKNRYELVIATSKRARQIAEGAEVKTKVKEESPVTLAANEIAEGKVEIVEPTEEKEDRIERGEEEVLVILSGVSGAGKDTIKKELLKRISNAVTLPSFTSRDMRPGEVEGDHYHFISKEEFEEKIRKGDFYEYDLHHGNYYGTSRELMGNKIKEGKIIIKDIEVNGTENLLKILGNDTRIVTIFLKVGKEELKRRLIERGDNIQDIEVRLGRLEYEEDKIKLYDYVIKNDDFEKTVQVIMTIIENEKRIEDECV